MKWLSRILPAASLALGLALGLALSVVPAAAQQQQRSYLRSSRPLRALSRRPGKF